MKIKPLSVCLLSSVLLLESCKDPKNDPVTGGPTPVPDSGAVYVVNEGGFGQSNGDISLYDKRTGHLQNNLFLSKNQVSPGDILQSITFHDQFAYLVVNNSNKIEVVHASDTASFFNSAGTITGLAMPRYMMAYNGIGYVTEYVSFSGNGRVSIINLSSKTVTGNITVGQLPEDILFHNGKILVCNSGDSTVSVIDPNTNLVESTVYTIPGPKQFFVDQDSFVYVCCAGYTDFSTPSNSRPGGISRINPLNTSSLGRFNYYFGNNQAYASSFTYDKATQTFYFVYNSVVNKAVKNGNSFNQSVLINRNFYSLGLDNKTGVLYAGTYGFSSNQEMIRYTQAGNPLDSLEVGIGPNAFVFRE